MELSLWLLLLLLLLLLLGNIYYFKDKIWGVTHLFKEEGGGHTPFRSNGGIL